MNTCNPAGQLCFDWILDLVLGPVKKVSSTAGRLRCSRFLDMTWLQEIIPWARKTMKSKGCGHLKNSLFTIKTSKDAGLGAQGIYIFRVCIHLVPKVNCWWLTKNFWHILQAILRCIQCANDGFSHQDSPPTCWLKNILKRVLLVSVYSFFQVGVLPILWIFHPPRMPVANGGFRWNSRSYHWHPGRRVDPWSVDPRPSVQLAGEVDGNASSLSQKLSRRGFCVGSLRALIIPGLPPWQEIRPCLVKFFWEE